MVRITGQVKEIYNPTKPKVLLLIQVWYIDVSPDNLHDPPSVVESADVGCIGIPMPPTKLLRERIYPNDKPLLTAGAATVRTTLRSHQSRSRISSTCTWIPEIVQTISARRKLHEVTFSPAVYGKGPPLAWRR